MTADYCTKDSTATHGHVDCKELNGPFVVENVVTNRRIRPYSIHTLSRAFRIGDEYYRDTGCDYIVRDRELVPVPRSKAERWLRHASHATAT